MTKFKLKNNKHTYYAVSDWLNEYDYASQDALVGVFQPIVQRKNPYTTIDFNSFDYKKMRMKDMYLFFDDPMIEMKFILTMMSHIEEIAQ